MRPVRGSGRVPISDQLPDSSLAQEPADDGDVLCAAGNERDMACVVKSVDVRVGIQSAQRRAEVDPDGTITIRFNGEGATGAGLLLAAGSSGNRLGGSWDGLGSRGRAQT